ncbi:MAG: SGNH/GDSL hydrolase family protein, partial [Eubacteriales bacterium]
ALLFGCAGCQTASDTEETKKETTVSESGTADGSPTTAPATSMDTQETEFGRVTALEEGAVIDRYDPDTAMKYIWEGPIVYNESVMFVGKDDEASLLYTPDTVFSVRSCDLKTEYREGIDYEVKDGKICLTEDTSIPYMTVEEYYPDQPIPGGSFPSRLPEHPNLRFGEGDTFIRYQVYVTYSHLEHWDRYVPEGQSGKFPRTIEKLRNGDPVTVLFFGDSITEGYNSSGFIGVEPYADSWSQMTATYLGEYYGNDRVRYINTGLAGQNSDWALATVQANVIDYAPDLVVLAFGMNDGGMTAVAHTNNMLRVIGAIRSALPETEIVLVSTMLPNEEAQGFWGNQNTFEATYLKNVAKKYSDVAIVRMTSMHSLLLESKEYYHMTGNNINHPNDFLSRIYAQSVVRTITGSADEQQ